MMKRTTHLLLCLCLLLSLLSGVARAYDESRSYAFRLTADNQEQLTVTPGQIITVALVLERTDSTDPATMYATQAELLYDDSFFQLVEGSIMTSADVQWADMARRTGGRAFYLNFLSLSGGAQWASRVQLGSFQLQVTGMSGTSVIRATNCLVSTQNGTGSYLTTSNDVTVVVTTDCTVTFQENGGSEVQDMTVQYGETIPEPSEPTREGYAFNGWYSDLDRTQAWDFAADTVQGNMTLYAGWLQGEVPSPAGSEREFPWLFLFLLVGISIFLLHLLLLSKKKVTFDTDGGTELDPVSVKKGDRIPAPMTPMKPGALFLGWYADPEKTIPWAFERDTVERSITLYARWM